MRTIDAHVSAPRIGMRTTLLVAALAALLALAAPARADFGIKSFSATVSTHQAGAHPDATTSFTLNSHQIEPFPGNVQAVPDDNAKTFVVGLPPGLSGNPQAVPRCTAGAMASNNCSPDAQVGLATLVLATQGDGFPFTTAVYNLVPEDGHTAEFGFVVIIAGVHIVATVRDDGDYGLTTTISNVSALIPVLGSSLTFWGVPADPSHDNQRGQCAGSTDPNCSVPSGAARKPFMTNPTFCGIPGSATITADSWQHPGQFVPTMSSAPESLTGCDALTFNPTIDVTPDSSQADAPSGLTVDLKIPQNDQASGLATPTLQKAVVALPPGVSISPAAADGLAACSRAQVGIGTKSAPSCPEASIVGDVSITSPLLSDPLTGPIYVDGTTAPFRIYLDAEGSGIKVRLQGDVAADPATGQLTATFADNPPLPFSDFKLHFKGGPRAILAMPEACGTHTVATQLTASSGQVATPSTAFGIGGCSGGFSPGFSAGTANPRAGAFTPFSLQVTRPDGQQALTRIDSVSLPPGLVANVGSVPLCDAGSAAAGTCGEQSRVGTVTVGAGAGSHPLYLSGGVYLTQGFAGAPFGLSIVVPAKAGPFDLGTVVIRSAIRVNNDASLSVETSPLPTTLAGIPLRLRDVRISLDRPRFMFNPTNCSPMSIRAAVAGETTGVGLANRFQVGECSALAFKPKLTASTKGQGSRTKGASLKVTITAPSGQANLKSVQVTLPKALAARLTTAQKACTQAQFAANNCPAASKVGGASATTPILPAPLKGPVYLVAQSTALPKLVVQLSGSGINIQLDGNVTISKSQQTVTTFGAIPDVPISRFDLDLPSGNNSVLSSTKNLCSGKLAMPTRLVGQNGKSLRKTTVISNTGCKGSRRAKNRTTANKSKKQHHTSSKTRKARA
jgi:hypothetical protein